MADAALDRCVRDPEKDTPIEIPLSPRGRTFAML
jgi:hypothetical protein